MLQTTLNFEIEIDGGINNETALICKNYGANVLVAGSKLQLTVIHSRWVKFTKCELSLLLI